MTKRVDPSDGFDDFASAKTDFFRAARRKRRDAGGAGSRPLGRSPSAAPPRRRYGALDEL